MVLCYTSMMPGLTFGGFIPFLSPAIRNSDLVEKHNHTAVAVQLNQCEKVLCNSSGHWSGAVLSPSHYCVLVERIIPIRKRDTHYT